MALVLLNNENIIRAAEILSRGGLAAFPTETVYGLGGDAFNPKALARIFEAKGRPRFDPLIVHIADLNALETVADLSLLDSTGRKNLAILTAQCWPGPLTLIVPKQTAVPELATSGLPTVAVRLPRHEGARQLIRLSTGAIAAPSANPFGYLSPTRAEHVLETLGEKVEIILDGGPSPVGVESTVLDLCNGRPRILRPGGTPQEAIEALIGPLAADAASPAAASAAGTGGMASPGLLKSHYAPRAVLIAYPAENVGLIPEEADSAYLFFDGASRDAWLASLPSRNAFRYADNITVLSETGNVIEAAARLFETLHELDRSGISRIHAQMAPPAGLGAAINDRLRRAAAR